MAPLVIDLRRTEDARDVVHRAVQALAEGRIVGLPTETDYVIAVGARDAGAVDRVRGLFVPHVAEPPLALTVKSADEALDWAPRMTPLARRLARRCWPGPVEMLVPDDHPESLLSRLPVSSREALVVGGHVKLRVPGHPLLSDCLRMLAGPVALAAVGGERPAFTAAELVERCGAAVSLVIDDGRTRYAQPVSTVTVDEAGLRVVRPGIVSEETLRRLASLMVLFVCTGNTCRSPMAETIFRGLFAERLGCRPDEIEQRGVVVASCGLAAFGGGKASGNAVAAMAERGGDLSGHESQPVSESLIRQADVILTMTASHRAALLAQFPEAGGRVAMLSPDRRDVLDPIGGTLETYRKCAQQILGHLAARLDTLCGELPGRGEA